MKKVKFLPIALACLMLTESCATVLSHSYATVHVPPGVPNDAKVYADGKYVSNTPADINIPKSALKDGYAITIKADGKEQTTKIHRKTMVGWVILDVFCGLYPLVIDLATGNLNTADQKSINYNLNVQ